jgi:hypothetical protein
MAVETSAFRGYSQAATHRFDFEVLQAFENIDHAIINQSKLFKQVQLA